MTWLLNRNSRTHQSRKYILICWCVFLISASWPSLGHPDGLLEPFAINNQNPFIRIFGIPRMTTFDAVPAGVTHMDVSLDVVSNFTSSTKGQEAISIDGETHLATLRLRRGVGRGWEVGVELPWLVHSGGFFDSFVLGWHNLFNLPKLGRDNVSNNILKFRYDRNGRTPINIDTKRSGLGDIVLFAGRRLSINQSMREVNLRGQIKLPTGDSKDLLGSGGTDLSIWLQARQRINSRWSLYGGAGMAYLGQGDVLPELQRHWVVFGSTGIGWHPHSRIGLKLQFDGQSSIYRNTDLQQLKSAAIQATLGVSFKLNKTLFVDIAVVEDELLYDITPDVGFHLRLRYLPEKSSSHPH